MSHGKVQPHNPPHSANRFWASPDGSRAHQGFLYMFFGSTENRPPPTRAPGRIFDLTPRFLTHGFWFDRESTPPHTRAPVRIFDLTPRFLIHGFLFDRRSAMLGVWAAPDGSRAHQGFLRMVFDSTVNGSTWVLPGFYLASSCVLPGST